MEIRVSRRRDPGFLKGAALDCAKTRLGGGTYLRLLPLLVWSLAGTLAGLPGCASAPPSAAASPGSQGTRDVGAPLPTPPRPPLAPPDGAAASSSEVDGANPSTTPSPPVAPAAQAVGAADYREGRLRAHPHAVTKPGPRGLWTLDLGAKQRALLYVPPTVATNKPAPLVIVFHGRHGSAEVGLGVLRDAADASGFLLLAPEAVGDSWDVIATGAFGPDIANLDRALSQVFGRYSVDPQKLAAAGFSDGGSYALSVALTNGGLFSHAMAYSPGMLRVKSPDGAPLVFVSHGINDKELPIGSTSRLMVPVLRNNGYDVRAEEFRGGHSVPPELLKASVSWFLKTNKEPSASMDDPDLLPPPPAFPAASPEVQSESASAGAPGPTATPTLPPPGISRGSRPEPLAR